MDVVDLDGGGDLFVTESVRTVDDDPVTLTEGTIGQFDRDHTTVFIDMEDGSLASDAGLHTSREEHICFVGRELITASFHQHRTPLAGNDDPNRPAIDLERVHALAMLETIPLLEQQFGSVVHYQCPLENLESHASDTLENVRHSGGETLHDLGHFGTSVLSFFCLVQLQEVTLRKINTYRYMLCKCMVNYNRSNNNANHFSQKWLILNKFAQMSMPPKNDGLDFTGHFNIIITKILKIYIILYE